MIKDLKVGEIYISLREDKWYLTIDSIQCIKGDDIYKRSWFHDLRSGIFDYDKNDTPIFKPLYNFYEFRDCFLEDDLKPYHKELKKLIEYFESFPENRVYLRKRKLEILEGLL